VPGGRPTARPWSAVGDFPPLNILINNAGIMRKINLRNAEADPCAITREVETNLSGSTAHPDAQDAGEDLRTCPAWKAKT
jgi:hypothetical protein